MNVFYKTSSIFIAMFLAQHVHASYLYFDPPIAEIYPGDTLTVSVRIDTDDEECINAVESVISYPPNVQLVDVSRGSSIFTMWVEEPTIHRDDNTLSFAGGIPNGYCGRVDGDPQLTNKILELIFQAPSLSIGLPSDNDGAQSVITFGEETKVYLNDGFGSVRIPRTNESRFVLHKKPGAQIRSDWFDMVASDTLPPEQFSITLESDESIFSNRYFITFNTTDKQSGLSHYEVIEEPFEVRNFFNWGSTDAPWVKTRSPYLLKDQTLNSIIRVKAVDKAGNEYVATFVPEDSNGLISFGVISLLLAIGGVTLLTFVLFLYFKKRKYAIQRDDSYDDTSSSV